MVQLLERTKKDPLPIPNPRPIASLIGVSDAASPSQAWRIRAAGKA